MNDLPSIQPPFNPSSELVQLQSKTKMIYLRPKSVLFHAATDQHIRRLQREGRLYAYFAKNHPELPLPHLVKTWHFSDAPERNKRDWYCLLRSAGEPLSQANLQLTLPQLRTLSIQIVRVLAQVYFRSQKAAYWQKNPLPQRHPSRTKHHLKHWFLRSVGPTDFTTALTYLWQRMIRWSDRHIPWLSWSDTPPALFLAHLQELSSIPWGLIHGDLHMDQILIDPASKRLTAVLDWGNALWGHPVWDLNLIRLGPAILPHRKQFAQLHQTLWQEWSEIAQYPLRYPQALHTYYRLFEISFFLRQDRINPQQICHFTGRNMRESLQEALHDLHGDQVSSRTNRIIPASLSASR